MAISDEDKKYVYKSTLRDVYGLTAGMIAQLGEPDLRVKNPHHRSTSAYLYLIERVERWIEEHQVEVDKVKAARPTRSARAKAQYEQRRQQLMDWAASVVIEVTWPDDIFKAAESYYADEEDYYGVSEGGLVAYARHNCTNYHDLLNHLRGFVPGGDEAYQIIKHRVNDVCAQRIYADVQGANPEKDITF